MTLDACHVLCPSKLRPAQGPTPLCFPLPSMLIVASRGTKKGTHPKFTPFVVVYGCGSKPMVLGAPPILGYFSGDWDVHWGHGMLTHATSARQTLQPWFGLWVRSG